MMMSVCGSSKSSSAGEGVQEQLEEKASSQDENS